MRYISKATYAIAVIAAVAVTASAADARSYRAYDGAYNSVGGGFERSNRSSIPYDAGGVAYSRGQRGQDDSSDFQLQGR
ncbi:MAG TPA: hypothetical protein VH249_22870 [Xanthobacteraceae bacterium]|jgi:hypothetical protein|nr:hypothetical protein [Xanthobacteraceae bacterium]